MSSEWNVIGLWCPSNTSEGYRVLFSMKLDKLLIEKMLVICCYEYLMDCHRISFSQEDDFYWVSRFLRSKFLLVQVYLNQILMFQTLGSKHTQTKLNLKDNTVSIWDCGRSTRPAVTDEDASPGSRWRGTWGCPAASSPVRSAVAPGGSWRWRGRWVWGSWRCWRWRTEPRRSAWGATSPTPPADERSCTGGGRKTRGLLMKNTLTNTHKLLFFITMTQSSRYTSWFCDNTPESPSSSLLIL